MNLGRSVSLLALVLVLCSAALVWAQSSLGSGESFAVLAGSGVTNTGPSVVTGDLGTHPTASVTGFPPGTVSGTIHAGDAVAVQAQNDLTAQWNAIDAESCTANLTGQDLGGKTLTPGTYCFDSSAGLTGTLTLDAQGDSNATFIFKTGSTLTTASSSSVDLINGGDESGVAWRSAAPRPSEPRRHSSATSSP